VGGLRLVRVVPVLEEHVLEVAALVRAALAICAGGLALAKLFLVRIELRETTLLPAWGWMVAAAVAWTAVEAGAALAPDGSAWLAPARMAAVGLSFCPVVAVLGAKRPQHRAWTFVVLAFWGIVMLPAAEAFFLQRGDRLALGDARRWFLWILLLLGPINYVPTRQWAAALLLAAAQFLALSEHLPLVRQTLFREQYLVALSLATAAVWAGQAPGRGTLPATNAYDRLWCDFRDLFGLLWALRLQERVNAVVDTNHWPLWLAWGGLRDTERGLPVVAIDSAIEPILRTSMKGLLRRFVSNDWIARRLGQDID
jgi:hypothetical protein